MMKTRTLQLTLVVSAFVSPLGSTTEQGEALYAEHCATCHAVSSAGVSSRRFAVRSRLHDKMGASSCTGVAHVSNE